MKKNQIFFIAIFALIVIEIKSESVFKQTFNLLHREPPPPKSISRQRDVPIKWIDQKVDNFDTSNTDTWKMRYMENDEHFKEGGPIFIFVGGEWEITPGFITGGHFYDMAQKKNAYLFYTEHRYYGESHPTSDLSLANLKYLSAKQALADLAHFIKQIKIDKPELKESKVLLAGGSYSASMVVWFKKLYPNLAVGSWASSAPLYAQVDFDEYKIVTGESIKTVGGQECYNRIDKGFKQLEDMFKNKQIAEIHALLKICSNFDSNNELDVWSLFSTMSDLFAGLVQGSTKGSIEKACDLIMSADDDLVGIARWYLSRLHGHGCYDVSYQDSVNSLSEVKYTNNIMRQWFYQTCTEFGWYQTSTAKNQPFGTQFPIELYEKLCEDVYQISKEKLYENIEETNELYGGWKPNVKNVFMTHGSLDPWSAMGLPEHEGAKTHIPLYSHCKDFPSISADDSVHMKDAKESLQKSFFKWLEEK